MSDKPEDHGPVERIVLFRLGSIEKTMLDLADKVGRLILIEERQTRTSEALDRVFSTLKSQDDRVRTLELAQPTTDLEQRLRALELAQPITNRTNVWVERAMLFIVGAAVAGASLWR